MRSSTFLLGTISPTSGDYLHTPGKAGEQKRESNSLTSSILGLQKQTESL